MNTRPLVVALPFVVGLLAAACAADPTPKPEPTATLAATPTMVSTPTPTTPPRPPIAEPCPPSADGTVYEVAEFVIDDDRFELRMGTERFWGYAAEETVSSTAPLGGIAMRVNPGDTIRIATVRSSASRSTRVHGITVPELGVDIELAPGESQDGVEIVVCELGTYAIDDYRDPGSHAYADIIVEEPPEPVVVTADPVVYEIHTIVVEDGLFELRMGSEPYWGYAAGDQIRSNEGPGVVMTVKVGDTINVGTVRRAGSRTTKLHYFTIEALGIDHAMVSGGSIEPLVLEFTEAGTIVVDDSSDPGEHGVFKIVVEP